MYDEQEILREIYEWEDEIERLENSEEEVDENKEEINQIKERVETLRIALEDARNPKPKHLYCKECLEAIKSRGEDIIVKTHYVDEDDEIESRCYWCEEYGFDELYEVEFM